MKIAPKILNKSYYSMNPLVRDFTKSAEEEMKRIASEVAEADDDYISKLLTDRIGRWLDNKGYLNLLSSILDYKSTVIDIYNYGALQIEKICEAARTEDQSTGAKLQNNCVGLASNICIMLNELAECVNLDSSVYDARQSVGDRLQWFSNHWLERDGNLIQINLLQHENSRYWDNRQPQKIYEQDILDFCNNQDAVVFFDSYTTPVFTEIFDLNFAEALYIGSGYVLYNGHKMLVNDFIALFTKEGYDEKLVRKELNKLISRVISAESTYSARLKKYDTAKELCEDLFADYLDDTKDNMKDGPLKEFVDILGIDVIKELIETCPQVLDYLVTDYSNGLSLLEQLESSSSGTEMKEAINHIKYEYHNKLIGVLGNLKDMTVNLAESVGEDTVQECLKTVFGEELSDNLSLIKSVVEFTETDFDGYKELLVLKTMALDIDAAYMDAVETIKSGTYTEADLQTLQQLFELKKETSISILETYRDMNVSDPDAQIKANEQLRKLKNATLTNWEMA